MRRFASISGDSVQQVIGRMFGTRCHLVVGRYGHRFRNREDERKEQGTNLWCLRGNSFGNRRSFCQMFVPLFMALASLRKAVFFGLMLGTLMTRNISLNASNFVV